MLRSLSEEDHRHAHRIDRGRSARGLNEGDGVKGKASLAGSFPDAAAEGGASTISCPLMFSPQPAGVVLRAELTAEFTAENLALHKGGREGLFCPALHITGSAQESVTASGFG